VTRTKSIRTSAAKLAAIAAAATLALSACSSSTTAQRGSSGSSGKAAASLACPTGKLIGEGSSAQKNAIDEIIAAYGGPAARRPSVQPDRLGAGIRKPWSGRLRRSDSR
jgi:phosphate transport system substrate-binding protein